MLCFAPLIVLGWLAWFAITLLLTFLGLVIALAGGLVWLIGRAITVRWPDAGADIETIGRGLARGVVHAVDRMNGHTDPSGGISS